MSSVDRVRSVVWSWTLSMTVACAAGWLITSYAAPASAELRTLFEFRAPNGAEPTSLVRASDGTYYGTTHKGGTYGRGAVFSITARGSIRHVYSFSGGDDGAEPTSLTFGPDGHLYGLASFVTPDNNLERGVFRVTTAGRYRLLQRGQIFFERLIFAHGALYAPTVDGTIYRVRTNGQLVLLYTIDGSWATQLIGGETNQLYGATYAGAVFRLGTNGTYTALAQLAPPSDSEPAETPSALARSSDGVLYVAAERGSTARIYKLASDQPLAPYADLAATAYQLVAARSGVVYGATSWGGAAGQGTLFRVASNGEVDTWYEFSGERDGATPTSLLYSSSDGLVGTTRFGGTGYGGVFRLRTDNQTFRSLHVFEYPFGTRPSAIVQGPDGALYGVTQRGGPNGFGTVFKASTRGSVQNLYVFSKRDGAEPHSLALGPDGAFYGRTRSGSTLDRGGVFRITTTGEFSTLIAFDVEGQSDGPAPLVDADGTVRGADQAGSGHLFYLPFWQYSVLYSFPGQETRDGADPNGLIRGADGELFGTTTGAYGPLIPPFFSRGTIFRYAADGTFSTLLALDELEDEYALPQGLVYDGDGALYYATSNLPFLCGTYGSLQKLDLATNTGSTVHAFTGREDGTGPVNLIHQADGTIYGLTVGGNAQTSEGDEPYVCGRRNATVFRYTSAGLSTRETFPFRIQFDADPGRASAWTAGSDGRFYGVANYGLEAASAILFAYIP